MILVSASIVIPYHCKVATCQHKVTLYPPDQAGRAGVAARQTMAAIPPRRTALAAKSDAVQEYSGSSRDGPRDRRLARRSLGDEGPELEAPEVLADADAFAAAVEPP